MFKRLILCALFLSLISTQSFAVTSSAAPVRVKFASANMSTGSWTALVNTTAKAIKGVSVSNSSLAAIQIGLAGYTAGYGAEAAQLVVPGMPGNYNALQIPAPVFYPMTAGSPVRISAIALDASATTGELDVNLIYN